MAEREEEEADDGVGAGSNPPALRSCKVGSFFLLTTLFFTLFINSLCPTLALSRNRHLLSHSLRFLLIFLNLPGKKKKAGCLAILF